MHSATDIPDWCVIFQTKNPSLIFMYRLSNYRSAVEGLAKEYDPCKPLQPEEAAILWEKSPIRYVERVRSWELIVNI